jgi:hypothetical protein
MQSKSLRGAISESIGRDKSSALRALQQSGAQLSSSEQAALKSGNLGAFSDKQLAERFNAKVLGAMGIDASAFSEQRGGQSKGGQSKNEMESNRERSSGNQSESSSQGERKQGRNR